MERRELLKGMLLAFGAGAVGLSVVPSQAAAASPPPLPELKPEETSAQDREPEVEALDEAEKDSDGQYYYYRRPRRIYRRRRVVYYRRPRPVYYRPRRAYYRPRRVYSRRRYYW